MFIQKFLFLLFVACLSVNAANTNKILVVGDSLSAEYGLQRGEGWVALLRQKLRDTNLSSQVINASISGDTTSNALARLAKTLSVHSPDIVIIELGGNDGLRGLSPEEMQSNLNAMIEQAKQRESRVILVSVNLPPNYGRRYTQRFQNVYIELAQIHGIALVPSIVDDVGLRKDLMQKDRTHPNAKAQPMILEKIWQTLAPLLEDSA
ncbi:MAG: arylesterase [Arenicellales bacterium WSBS_2016_MAG_OTU3]